MDSADRENKAVPPGGLREDVLREQVRLAIVVSSVAQKGSNQRLRAQDIGAFDVIDKEDLKMYQGLATATQILTSKIKLAAVAHVKKRTEAEIGHIQV